MKFGEILLQDDPITLLKGLVRSSSPTLQIVASKNEKKVLPPQNEPSDAFLKTKIHSVRVDLRTKPFRSVIGSS